MADCNKVLNNMMALRKEHYEFRRDSLSRIEMLLEMLIALIAAQNDIPIDLILNKSKESVISKVNS